MKRAYKLTKTSFEIDGYRYNVVVLLSLDGRNYYYAGIGRFVHDLKEANEYVKEYESKYEKRDLTFTCAPINIFDELWIGGYPNEHS